VQLWELQVCSHWTAVQVANGINLVRRCLPAKGINGSANAMLKKTRNQTETEAATIEQRTTHSHEATTLSPDLWMASVRNRVLLTLSTIASEEEAVR
jgi:hypothetical protein